MSTDRRPSAVFLTGVGLVIPLWLAAVLVLGARGVFLAPASRPPLATLLALVLPPLAFSAALKASLSFRANVLAVDPVWLCAIQGLRVVGAAFLFLYSFGHLPGLFAHPAGWGDMLVGALAPFMAARLAADRGFLSSKGLWRFHALGMLDFVGAVGSAVLSRYVLPSVNGMSSTAALGRLPLLLIPCFAVPLWICFHLAAFAQIRRARAEEK